MKARVIDYSQRHSLNECIVMSYYLLPPVNHHQQADLFSFHNYNDRLRLDNQKPNTSYIFSEENTWIVEIANLTAKNDTLLDVNISASTQLIDLKLWK